LLSTDLLRVRIRKGVVRPAFLTPEDAPVIQEVLDVFAAAAENSWRYAELEERISYLSKLHDYRLIRGLSRLMERRLTLSRRSDIPPAELRGLLFSMGPVLSPEGRESLLRSVASKYGTSVEEIESAMFADVEREKLIAGVAQLGPDELMKWYNAELTETLLARSLSLRVYATRLWSSILRRIKWLGLMYEVLKGDESAVEVMGPASVLKAYDRYSRATSGLVPLLIEIGEWRLEGDVKLGERILPFTVESSQSGMAYPPDIARRSARAFDSSVEERLYRALSQAAPDLRLYREPAPLDLGPWVMVPDFAVEIGGRRVFIEVVGFWTPEYLRRKVEKLRQLRGVDIILVADRSLGPSRMEGLGELIFYEGEDLPVKRLLEALRRRSGTDGSAAPEVRAPEGEAHPLMESGLEVLLDDMVGRTFVEVERVLRPLLGDGWLRAIESRGYSFDWSTLDVNSARLRRREKPGPFGHVQLTPTSMCTRNSLSVGGRNANQSPGSRRCWMERSCTEVEISEPCVMPLTSSPCRPQDILRQFTAVSLRGYLVIIPPYHIAEQ